MLKRCTNSQMVVSIANINTKQEGSVFVYVAHICQGLKLNFIKLKMRIKMF